MFPKAKPRSEWLFDIVSEPSTDIKRRQEAWEPNSDDEAMNEQLGIKTGEPPLSLCNVSQFLSSYMISLIVFRRAVAIKALWAIISSMW